MRSSCPWIRDEKDVKVIMNDLSPAKSSASSPEPGSRMEPGAVFQFADFELDLGREELRENGRPIPLRPQAISLLSLLVQKAGGLVTREEIEAGVWGPGESGHEQGINACVREIRRALSDDPRAPGFIETVPKRGYRFIGAVEMVGDDDDPAPLGSVANPGRRLRWSPSALLGVVAVAALSTMLWVFSRPSVGADAEPVWIAVAPVQHGEEPADRAAAETLVTEMIALGDLQSTQQLRVTPWEARWVYDRSTGTVEENGRELGVDYVLETELRRTGGRTVVALHLFRLTDGALLWSQAVEHAESQLQNPVREALSGMVEVIRQLGS